MNPRLLTSILLLALVWLTPGFAIAQDCVIPKPGTQTDADGIVYVGIVVFEESEQDAAKVAIARAGIITGIEEIDQCMGGGETGPRVVLWDENNTEHPNIPDLTVFIKEKDTGAGASTSNRCGKTPDAVKGSGVYWVYSDPFIPVTNPPTPPCQWPHVGVHETAHAMGLKDVAKSCGTADYVMAKPHDTASRTTLSAEECEGLADGWNAPVDEPVSPLVLDLEDNGIATSSIHFDPVIFDLDGDGLQEEAGWLERGSADAFLWIDLNGDGVPNHGGELFGNGSILPGGDNAQNGIEALAVYDSNGDKKITPDDEVWPDLLLWSDRNHNARMDRSEKGSLGEEGIVGISLNASRRAWIDEHGNYHTFATAFWTRKANGRGYDRHLMEDIWFLVQPISDAPRR